MNEHGGPDFTWRETDKFEPITGYISLDDEYYDDAVQAFSVDYFAKEKKVKRILEKDRAWSGFWSHRE